MAWEHCDTTISDVESCPGCGITKEVWTLEFNVTRVFTIDRRRKVRFVLLDDRDEPVPHEPYEVELPNGELQTGLLDAEGTAKVPGGGAGPVLITFPLRHALEVLPYPFDEEEGQGDPEPGAEDPADHDAATFECEGPRRHRFRLRDTCFGEEQEDDDEGEAIHDLVLRLVDDDGEPIPGEPYRVTWRDGHVDEGRLAEDGTARLPGRAGVALVRFPHRSPHEVDAETDHAHERWSPLIASDPPAAEPVEDPEPSSLVDEDDREQTKGTGDEEPLPEEEPDDVDELAAGFDCAHSEEEHRFRLDDDQCLVEEEEEDEDDEPSEFHCEEADGVVVHADLQAAVAAARRLANETLPVTGSVCPTPPELCPADLHEFHRAGDALHLTELDDAAPGLLIRIAELAGLWGLDLSGETHSNRSRRQRRKAIHTLRGAVSSSIYPLGIKSMPTTAPWSDVSVVALRDGTTRHLHLHRGGPRQVYALVEGEMWRSLPIEAQTGPYQFGYTLHKSSWWMASYHRQWGCEHMIAWLLGLRTFYEHVTGQPLGIGDVSHIVGEDQTDHGSHELGVDVDLYVLDVAGSAPGVYSEPYYCSGPRSGELQLSRMRPPPEQPSAENRLPRFRPNHARGRLTDPDERRAVLRAYATIAAYCMVTRAQVKNAFWHGAASRELRDLAQEVVDETFGSDDGWRDAWGRLDPWTGEANPWVATEAAQVGWAPFQYWDNHEDHIHVRLHAEPRTARTA